ncbi:hypothetical protein TsFJ059_009785 [Trichoderma semiorbis]|uniref:Uncharacterized protein n=1 Tax=Trichoderma semiorbis TaxID=1491008 RepID=A0A9P8HMG6_9HYPO|nr:hypothetical protein TsFJ059_009785 [Trichoderma semiorbis]
MIRVPPWLGDGEWLDVLDGRLTDEPPPFAVKVNVLGSSIVWRRDDPLARGAEGPLEEGGAGAETGGAGGAGGGEGAAPGGAGGGGGG